MKQLINAISKNMKQFATMHNEMQERESRTYWKGYMKGIIALCSDFGLSVYVHHSGCIFSDIEYITISYDGNILEEIRIGGN